MQVVCQKLIEIIRDDHSRIQICQSFHKQNIWTMEFMLFEQKQLEQLKRDFDLEFCAPYKAILLKLESVWSMFHHSITNCVQIDLPSLVHYF